MKKLIGILLMAAMGFSTTYAGEPVREHKIKPKVDISVNDYSRVIPGSHYIKVKHKPGKRKVKGPRGKVKRKNGTVKVKPN